MIFLKTDSSLPPFEIAVGSVAVLNGGRGQPPFQMMVAILPSFETTT
jgi:hypothetical protein